MPGLLGTNIYLYFLPNYAYYSIMFYIYVNATLKFWDNFFAIIVYN